MSEPTNIKVYQGSEPDVYLIGQLYDPIVHGPLAEVNDGLVVPAIGSLIVDNVSVPGKYVLWTVDATDPITLASHLVPLHEVEEGIEGGDRILSYGNDTMMLYYDDRATPTRLIIDSKFVLIGSASAEYRLVKVIGEERIVISAAIDNNGQVISNRIPVIETAIPGVRKLSDCHTTHDIDDGEFVELEVYDATGVLTTRVRLITKRATILNDLLSSANPIVAFGAEANQNDGADWVIYVNQNPEDLTIWPEITYADGTKERVAIDMIQTHIYGMEEVVTTIPEAQYHVIIKHFLSDDIPSTIAQGEGVRFLIHERYIRIVQRGIFQYSKIMPIPLWNPTANEWQLSFVGYYESRDKFEYLSPSAVQYVGTPFDGSLYMEPQNITINSQIAGVDGEIGSFQQSFTVCLNGNANIAPWTIADTEQSEFIYGAETTLHNRPKLNYDVTRGSYFIPTSAFPDIVHLLDNFYYRTTPPYIAPAETTAPDPTHFVIRDGVNGRVLTAAPVEIATYDQEFTLLSNNNDPAQFNNSTVIVEFLLDEGNTYAILFGVPVEVETGVYNV